VLGSLSDVDRRELEARLGRSATRGRSSGGSSVKPAHEFGQLFAGVDSELGECVVQVGFDGVGGDVQLLCH
jgi:hypothetical protein